MSITRDEGALAERYNPGVTYGMLKPRFIIPRYGNTPSILVLRTKSGMCKVRSAREPGSGAYWVKKRDLVGMLLRR